MSYLDRDTYGIYRDITDTGAGPRLMGADTLLGEEVYNRQDESLGDIKEIMLDTQTGHIAYAVLAYGGWLGMGGKLFAVPWHSLTLDTSQHRFVLDCTKEQLQSAPGFDKHHWPDMASTAFATEIHSFYHTQQAPAGQRTASGSVMGAGTGTMQSDSSGGSMAQDSSQSGTGGSGTTER
jgi:sporulation protein YlmC with PRC-barrel domain